MLARYRADTDGQSPQGISVHPLPKNPKNGAREARNGHPSSVGVADDSDGMLAYPRFAALGRQIDRIVEQQS
jgi:hypothetical protein